MPPFFFVNMLKFKKFQIEDLACAAMHDGTVLSWEQGLGKSLAAIAWPLIKQSRRTLLVVPGGLHKQMKETAQKLFGVHLTSLPNVKTFYAHRLHLSPAEGATPRFFITTYQDLGYNGGDEWPDTITDDGCVETRADRMKARLIEPNLRTVYEVVARLKGTTWNPAQFFQGIGQESNGVRCLWRPTLSSVISAAEGIGGDRLILEHPIKTKNRLESMFRLLWWVCGGSKTPTARFPYEGTEEAREEFANQHLQHDQFLTREAEAAARAAAMGKKERRRIAKRSARICNIHHLWKLIAPIVLRRRKDDCGEEIMPKTIRPIYIMPGTAQQRVYAYHLENPPTAGRDTPTTPLAKRNRVGMQLNILRQAALCPHADSLGQVVTGVDSCDKRSWTDMNPKAAAILSLIGDLLDRGEQVIVGSPFREFSESLHTRLRSANVNVMLLDGTVTQEKRGELAEQFKRGVFSVMIAGLDAMGEGHSFECCANLIIPSYSWAYDTNEQFIHRVWRLNSPAPVTIYPMVMLNTVDERLAALFSEKGGSAQLALDGELKADTVEDIDPAMVLAAAVRNFRPDSETIDEQDMESMWHTSTQRRLELSELRFREIRGGGVPGVLGNNIVAAMSALPLPSPSPLAIAKQRLQNKIRRWN